VAATRGRPARMTVSCGSGARLRLPRVIVVVGGQGEVGAPVPSRARAPLVAAVMVRRVRPVAPVAVRGAPGRRRFDRGSARWSSRGCRAPRLSGHLHRRRQFLDGRCRMPLRACMAHSATAPEGIGGPAAGVHG
jgi:hypothetical protein